jgi:hypothetical protein
MSNHPPWWVKTNPHKYANLQNKEPHGHNTLNPTSLSSSDHRKQVIESIAIEGKIIITSAGDCFKYLSIIVIRINNYSNKGFLL